MLRFVLTLDKSKSVLEYVKNVRITSFSGPFFPAFGLNMEIFRRNLPNQSEYWKIMTRKNPNTDLFTQCCIFETTQCLCIFAQGYISIPPENVRKPKVF